MRLGQGENPSGTAIELSAGAARIQTPFRDRSCELKELGADLVLAPTLCHTAQGMLASRKAKRIPRVRNFIHSAISLAAGLRASSLLNLDAVSARALRNHTRAEDTNVSADTARGPPMERSGEALTVPATLPVKSASFWRVSA